MILAADSLLPRSSPAHCSRTAQEFIGRLVLAFMAYQKSEENVPRPCPTSTLNPLRLHGGCQYQQAGPTARTSTRLMALYGQSKRHGNGTGQPVPVGSLHRIATVCDKVDLHLIPIPKHQHRATVHAARQARDTASAGASVRCELVHLNQKAVATSNQMCLQQCNAGTRDCWHMNRRGSSN